MSVSNKYNRTYHFDFSPGTTSDDRINKEWRNDISKIKEIIHTEKMDGENTCMKGIGVFARSHAAPTTHPWSSYLKQKFSMIQKDLKDNDIELFGENIYAQHSIIYPNIDEHFYLFAVRHLDKWLSWEEVLWYADFFEYPVVPDLGRQNPIKLNDTEIIKDTAIKLSSQPSVFGSIQNGTMEPCTREGVVTRNIEEYSVNDFKHNVFKYVRASHVNTDKHWSRNWKRAPLQWEKKKV